MTKILIDRAMIEQALEALEKINKLSVGENAICLPAEIDGAMDALRAALAEPVQEPVALPDWFNHAFPGGKLEAVGFHMPTPRAYAEEMYKRWKSRIAALEAELAGLTDAQRKPLTDEEIYLETNQIDRNERGWAVKFARAIEAAHGIGEKK